MTRYRVMVVANLWPYEGDPGYGSSVQAQMESLRPLGVGYDVLFINGRESRWNYWRAVRELRRRLRETPYDLIHAHFGLSGLVARCQFKAPVVVSFMGDDVLGQFRSDGRITWMGRFYQFSSFLLAHLVAAVIVKSAKMKYKLHRSSADVIPNGVDLELFQPMEPAEARRKLGLDETKKYVLFPFDPAIQNKRHDLVKQSVALARREIPNLDLLVVFRTQRSSMPIYMSAADMLVLVSHSEGSPNVVKEALATNLPVISADVGDVRDLMDGVEGCHLAPREPDAIARKIEEVCRSGARTRGRERVASLAIDAVAKRIAAVYDRVLGRDRPR